MNPRGALLGLVILCASSCSGIQDLGLRRENASFGQRTLDLPARGAAVFATDGSWLASSDGRSLCVFDWPTGRLQRQLELGSGASDGRSEPLAVSSDGHWIAAVSADGRLLCVWNARTFESAARIALDGPRATALDCASSGQLFVADERGGLRRFDLDARDGVNAGVSPGAGATELVPARSNEGAEIVFLALSADEHTLILGQRSGASFACDARTGSLLWIDEQRRALALDREQGRLLMLSTLASTVDLCELAPAGPPTLVRTLGQGAEIGAERLAAFVPASELVLCTRPMQALGTRWDELELIDSRDGSLRVSVRLSAPLALAVAPDGRLFISAEERAAFAYDLQLLLAGR